MIPGIGNDPVILDLLQSRYSKLVATDYSEHAIERQHDLLSYEGQLSLENVELVGDRDLGAAPFGVRTPPKGRMTAFVLLVGVTSGKDRTSASSTRAA